MRISSSFYFQTGVNTINKQESDLLHLFQQIGSGRRMLTPADDPLAAAQAITLSQSQSMNQRFADNREVRSEEHTSELQSRGHLVCRLLLDKKKRPLRSICALVFFTILTPPTPSSTLFPYTTLFRSINRKVIYCTCFSRSVPAVVCSLLQMIHWRQLRPLHCPSLSP